MYKFFTDLKNLNFSRLLIKLDYDEEFLLYCITINLRYFFNNKGEISWIYFKEFCLSRKFSLSSQCLSKFQSEWKWDFSSEVVTSCCWVCDFNLNQGKNLKKSSNIFLIPLEIIVQSCLVCVYVESYLHKLRSSQETFQFYLFFSRQMLSSYPKILKYYLALIFWSQVYRAFLSICFFNNSEFWKAHK